MLKRVVSSVVSVACLLSATGAFAATNYEATKTVYYADNQIKVTSTISGASGDTATYLVYDKTVTDVSDITGENIVYVDQYKFTGSEANGKWEFSYVTDNKNIGATIKVGNGVENTGNAPTAIPGITYPVTVNCVGETLSWITTGTTDADEAGWVKIPFTTTHSLVKSVKLNGTTLSEDKWFTGADALWIKAELNNTSNTVEVETQEAATAVKMNSMGYFEGATTGNPDDITDPSIIAVATVSGSAKSVGIILTQETSKISDFIAGLKTDENPWDGSTSFSTEASTENVDSKIGIFPALGVNSQGQFAIRIYDPGAFTAGDTWYAVAYYLDSDGEVQFNKTYQKIKVPGAAQ